MDMKSEAYVFLAPHSDSEADIRSLDRIDEKAREILSQTVDKKVLITHEAADMHHDESSQLRSLVITGMLPSKAMELVSIEHLNRLGINQNLFVLTQHQKALYSILDSITVDFPGRVIVHPEEVPEGHYPPDIYRIEELFVFSPQ
jgi:hypothetical protein